MKKRTICFLRVSLALFLTLGVYIGISKYIQNEKARCAVHEGTIVTRNQRFVTERENIYTFINPNDFSDYVQMDLSMLCDENTSLISTAELGNNEIAIVLKNEKNGELEIALLNFGGRRRLLSGLTIKGKDFLSIGFRRFQKNYLLVIGSDAYLSDSGTDEYRLLAGDLYQRSPLFIDAEDIGYVNANGNLCFMSGREITVNELQGYPQGYVVEGKQLLVSRGKLSFIVDMDDSKQREKYSNHTYISHGCVGKHSVLEMIAQGSYVPFSDEEFGIKEWIRTDRRKCYHPFLYNSEIDDVQNLPMEIKGKRQNYFAHSYQNVPYNREMLERLKEVLETGAVLDDPKRR